MSPHLECTWLDRNQWPWEPRFVDVGPGRMHYIDVGHGPTVLFVHGTPTWGFEYRHLIAALSKTHRCIAMDHLGFGFSDRPRDFAYTPEAHARNLATFTDKLRLDSFSLVAHDYGGPISFPLAVQPGGRVERLVIFNTWAWSFEDDWRMRFLSAAVGTRLGRFLYRHANLELRVVLPAAWADRSKLTPSLYAHYASLFPDAWSRGAVLWPLGGALIQSSAHYRQIWEAREAFRRIPTLIMWGMKDPVFGLKQLRRWQEVIPDARVLELAGAGHWPHEEAPGEVIQAVAQHLSDPRRAGIAGGH